MNAGVASRQIGPWGSAARIAVGASFIALAPIGGPHWGDVALGLVLFPAAVIAALALRGRNAAPLRLASPWAHCVNIGVFVLALQWQPQATLLFYGASMLLAAWRGMGAGELFAVSNAVRHRDDQLGCPLFLPVDALESSRSRG